MNPQLQKNYLAGGAIAAYRVVKFGSADFTVLQAAAATDKSIGVLNQPGGAASGDRCDVVRSGIVDVEYGDTVTRGDRLTVDADGKVIAVTRHTHTENTAGAYAQNATTGVAASTSIIGIAEVSGVVGDIGKMMIAPSFN